MKAKKTKITYWIPFLAGFVFLVAGYLGLYAKLQMDRQQEICIDIDNSVYSDANVSVDIHVTKHWDDKDENGKACRGAQYDGVIINNEKYTLKDWKIEIILPDEGRIDSSWNGTFTMEGDRVIYVPDASIEMNILPAHDRTTFGFVMYSSHLMFIQQFRVRGYLYKQLTDYPFFFVLLGLTVLWMTGVFSQIVFLLRTRKMEQRRIMDEKIIIDTLQMLAKLIDAKDKYTNGHSDRVADYAAQLATEMNMDKEKVRLIRYMGLMHDCGKMGIPDQVLNKPDKLTEEEMAMVRSHTTIGGRILENFTAMPDVRECALYHHERYDGKGYPEKLAGEDIPLLARIICVADSFDAMNSDRCYRKHLGKKTIIQELQENAGKQFDPEIAGLMIRLIEEGKVICA